MKSASLQVSVENGCEEQQTGNTETDRLNSMRDGSREEYPAFQGWERGVLLLYSDPSVSRGWVLLLRLFGANPIRGTEGEKRLGDILRIGDHIPRIICFFVIYPLIIDNHSFGIPGYSC